MKAQKRHKLAGAFFVLMPVLTGNTSAAGYMISFCVGIRRGASKIGRIGLGVIGLVREVDFVWIMTTLKRDSYETTE